MAEIPSNILLADEFCKAGADGFSIGSNDLTMLILGADRDNELLASLFDERNLAVKRAIKSLIETAHQYGKTVSICGQAPSVYQSSRDFLSKQALTVYLSIPTPWCRLGSLWHRSSRESCLRDSPGQR